MTIPKALLMQHQAELRLIKGRLYEALRTADFQASMFCSMVCACAVTIRMSRGHVTIVYLPNTELSHWSPSLTIGVSYKPAPLSDCCAGGH